MGAEIDATADVVAMPSTTSAGEPDQRPGFVVLGDGEGVRAPSSTPPAAADVEAWDPSEHTVAEVLAYLDTVDDAERARILDAERAGKARSTILSA